MTRRERAIEAAAKSLYEMNPVSGCDLKWDEWPRHGADPRPQWRSQVAVVLGEYWRVMGEGEGS